MSYGEAWRLTLILLRDPSSEVCAATAGWQHSSTRAALATLDLYDLQHASKAKRKPARLPRPWDAKPTKHGGSKVLSIDEMRSVLQRNREEATE